MNFLALDATPPGVDPFAGWVIAGLVFAIAVLSGVVLKLALRGVEREVALGVLTDRCATAIEDLTQ